MEREKNISTESTIPTKGFSPLEVKAVIKETIFKDTFCPILIGFLMLAFAIWSISMIRMGILHQNDCPYGTNRDFLSLQTSLIVLGACLLGLIVLPFGVNILEYLENLISLIENQNSWRYLFYFFLRGFTDIFCGLMFLFSVCIGSVSVISGSICVYVPRNITLTFTNSSSHGYCDKTFFSFSFWSFTSTYIAIGVCLIIVIIFFCCKEFEENVKRRRLNSTFNYEMNRIV